MNALVWILLISGGFLSGSILFSKIIPKLLLHKDICEISDDGNPGAFNAFTHCGKGVGMLCLLLDILKGFIPVFLASMLMRTDGVLFTLAMIAPVLGHATGLFNRFHGGKCIAVSFGVMAGIIPVTWIGFAILAALYILFSTVIKINPNRLRSIIVYALFAVISSTVLSVIGLNAVAAGCGLIGMIAIVKHLKIKSFIQRNLSENEK